MTTRRLRVFEVRARSAILVLPLCIGCGASSSSTDDAAAAGSQGGAGPSTTAGVGGAGASGGDGVDLTTSSASSGGSGTCGGPEVYDCEIDADCEDGDPCTDDVCAASGEFFSCEHTDIADCQGDPTAPIDSSCKDGRPMPSPGEDAVWVPYVPLVAPNLAAACNVGFEWQNCTSTYDVTPTGACGAEDQTLYIDIATYTVGDRLRITGVGPDDQPYVLLDTCRIRTYETPDPTGGQTRPPDESIRQFTIHVLPGTQSIQFDASQTTSPWYMRVLGLCGFAQLSDLGTCAWRPASL